MMRPSFLSGRAGFAATLAEEPAVHRRQALRIALLLAAPLALGCGYPWTVVAQAEPNPFVVKRRFGVGPVAFENFRAVDPATEASRAAASETSRCPKEIDADTAWKWELEKLAISALFIDKLAEEGAKEGVQVVRSLEPGEAPHFVRASLTAEMPAVGLATSASSSSPSMMMSIRVTDAAGAVLDELRVRAPIEGVPANICGVAEWLSVSEALKVAVGRVALWTAEYLQLRVAGHGDDLALAPARGRAASLPFAIVKGAPL